MADETKVTEKVYCYDHPSAYKNDDALIGAIMSRNSNSDCGNAMMWNNPFVYLIWMSMFRNGGWGGENGNEYNSRQIAALQDTINTNHNNDLAMQAISGNTSAIRELATSMNCDFNAVQMAVCGVKSAIERIGGEIGMTGEKVINSVLLGNKDLLQTIQSCCCENKLLVTQQGYENRLAQKDIQFGITSRIDQLANGITQGFSATAYEGQRHTNDIIQSGNANTQRIVDTLNAHWNAELQQRYNDAKAELSQSYQTNNLTAQLNALAAAIAKIPTT